MRNRNTSCIERIIVSKKYKIKKQIPQKQKIKSSYAEEQNKGTKRRSNKSNMQSMQVNKQTNKKL